MTAYEMRISDWSSDVCSSDLTCLSCRAERARFTRATCPSTVSTRSHPIPAAIAGPCHDAVRNPDMPDRKSVVSGKSVSVRVDLDGSGNIEKKTKSKQRGKITRKPGTKNTTYISSLPDS